MDRLFDILGVVSIEEVPDLVDMLTNDDDNGDTSLSDFILQIHNNRRNYPGMYQGVLGDVVRGVRDYVIQRDNITDVGPEWHLNTITDVTNRFENLQLARHVDRYIEILNAVPARPAATPAPHVVRTAATPFVTEAPPRDIILAKGRDDILRTLIMLKQRGPARRTGLFGRILNSLNESFTPLQTLGRFFRILNSIAGLPPVNEDSVLSLNDERWLNNIRESNLFNLAAPDVLESEDYDVLSIASQTNGFYNKSMKNYTDLNIKDSDKHFWYGATDNLTDDEISEDEVDTDQPAVMSSMLSINEPRHYNINTSDDHNLSNRMLKQTWIQDADDD